MTYSKKHKYIFIHINKTGGTTISNTFKKYDHTAKIVTHRFLHPTKKYKSLTKRRSGVCTVGDNIKNYKIITCVRNPWDRILSCYKYRQARNTPDTVGVTFENWLLNRDVYKSYKTPDCWVKFNQLDWVAADNGECSNCSFLRFETIGRELIRLINNILHVDIKDIPHENKTSHLPYREYYTDNTIEYVSNLYKRDIETFNYQFEPSYKSK